MFYFVIRLLHKSPVFEFQSQIVVLGIHSSPRKKVLFIQQNPFVYVVVGILGTTRPPSMHEIAAFGEPVHRSALYSLKYNLPVASHLPLSIVLLFAGSRHAIGLDESKVAVELTPSQ